MLPVRDSLKVKDRKKILHANGNQEGKKVAKLYQKNRL